MTVTKKIESLHARLEGSLVETRALYRRTREAACWCVNCHEHIKDHAAGRCLFDASHFKSREDLVRVCREVLTLIAQIQKNRRTIQELRRVACRNTTETPPDSPAA